LAQAFGPKGPLVPSSRGIGAMGGPDGYDASQKIWVGNLPAEARDEDLDAHFRQLSEPVSAVVFKPGQGIVTYDSAEEANMAVSAFNGSEIGGAIIQTDSFAAKQSSIRGSYGKGGKAGKSDGGGYGAKNDWGGKSDWGGGKGGKPEWGGGWDAKGKAKGKFDWGAKGYEMKGYGKDGGWGAGGAAWGGAWGGKSAGKWGQEPQKWAPPAGSAAVHWLQLPPHSSLLAQGLPAVVYEKGDAVFGAAARVLGDLVGDIATEVQVIHDPDWEQFPEIGELVKAATGEDNCVAVFACPSRATWAVGVAAGWKGREAAGKVALAFALVSQDQAMMSMACRSHPEFGMLCRNQGLMGGPPVAPPPAASYGGWGGAAAASSYAEPSAEVPSVHFIALASESKITAAGLAAEAPAIPYTKAQKEYFSGAHNMLCEFVDPSEEVTFEDDPDGVLFPEVSAACTAAGAEENGICVATHAGLGAWAVGLGPGHEGRMRAAKLAMTLVLCQNQGKLEEFGTNNPEFGLVLANAGLIENPRKKRRKGGGQW